jgi:hypothetical protein
MPQSMNFKSGEPPSCTQNKICTPLPSCHHHQTLLLVVVVVGVVEGVARSVRTVRQEGE